MKCVVFVSEKMSAIPIVECGGIMLQANQKLIVKETLAPTLLRNYPNRLARGGHCDMDNLRGGSYQVVGNIVEVTKLEEKKEVVETPLAVVSSNRAMEGVGRKRIHRK